MSAMRIVPLFFFVAVAFASSDVTIDDGPGLGLRWEGVGAISGGGATTKLLMEYPEQARSDVLDFLFKPNFGLGLQILKVEIGGDTDATEGAEPSHMHSKGDENYQRGYEWWLMKEAKARNPDIKLYGLPWGWPGWLDPKASADHAAKDAFVDPELTANYTLAWLLGAKREHSLTIDYIGQWNERDAPESYDKALRKAVEASELNGKTTVLKRLVHYPGTNDHPDGSGCKQYQWNTTDGSRWVDEEGSIFDGRSARCLARCMNRNYISGCHTATFQWHLVSSFYDYLPWARDGVAVANQPWSGAYEITSPTWSLAHTSQFAPIGWRYAAHGSGVGMLKNGGSLVTRVSPDMRDFSIVIEKMSSANSNCARGSNPRSAPTSEDLVLTLKGAFLAAARRSGINVWYSNLTSSNELGVNPTEDQLFQQKQRLFVLKDGTIKLRVNPEEVYTLTTLSVGGKGASKSPSASPFPIPFVQAFDDEHIHSPPKIWYDQMGAWEIQKSPYAGDEARGNIMRQVVPVWPQCWGYSCSGPTTYFGPSEFNGALEITMEVRLEDHAVFTLSFLDANNKKVKFDNVELDSTGKVELGNRKVSADVGVNRWHKVSVLNANHWQAVVLDGKLVANNSLSLAHSETCDETSFPFDLSGKQALGLKPGPRSAATVQACQQACCDAGTACDIFQFDQHASLVSKCWIGKFTGFQDTTHKYQSRSRVDPTLGTPYHLKVLLSRYVFAAIDNFKIQRIAEPSSSTYVVI